MIDEVETAIDLAKAGELVAWIVHSHRDIQSIQDACRSRGSMPVGTRIVEANGRERVEGFPLGGKIIFTTRERDLCELRGYRLTVLFIDPGLGSDPLVRDVVNRLQPTRGGRMLAYSTFGRIGV